MRAKTIVIEATANKTGQEYLRIKAGNGKIICTTEPFDSRANAWRAAKMLVGLHGSRIVFRRDGKKIVMTEGTKET